MPFPKMSADADKLPAGVDHSGATKSDYKPKRKTKKQQQQFEQPVDTSAMLVDAQRIIRAEIERLKVAIGTRELYQFETKQLELYVRMMLAMERKSNTDSIADLSDDELLALAKKAIDDERK